MKSFITFTLDNWFESYSEILVKNYEHLDRVTLFWAILKNNINRSKLIKTSRNLGNLSNNLG